MPCGARETILEPLRPGVTVNLGQQQFVLPRSCKSWLARFSHIEALSEMALRGDWERNIRAAIEFVAAVQKDKYPRGERGLGRGESRCHRAARFLRGYSTRIGPERSSGCGTAKAFRFPVQPAKTGWFRCRQRLTSGRSVPRSGGL